MRVLLVDDNAMIRGTLRRLLSRIALARSWHLVEETSPSRALIRALDDKYDLVATDLRFDGHEMTGLDLVRALRLRTTEPPILVYSAWPWTEAERAQILIAGADDVMSVPLEAPLEFVARGTALGRRASGPRRLAHLTLGNVTVDLVCRHVYVGDVRVDLTRDQHSLITVLVGASPRPVSFDDLASSVGYTSAHDRGAIIEAIRRLRLKIAEASIVIESVKGFGYRLIERPLRIGDVRAG